MARVRLLYVKSYLDRHGKVRHYFRRKGCPPIALPGIPGSPEFMEAYQAALAGHEIRREIGKSRSLPGSLSEAIAAYYVHNSFVHGFSVETQYGVFLQLDLHSLRSCSHLWVIFAGLLHHFID